MALKRDRIRLGVEEELWLKASRERMLREMAELQGGGREVSFEERCRRVNKIMQAIGEANGQASDRS